MSKNIEQFNDIFPAEYIEPQYSSFNLYYIVAIIAIIIVTIAVYFALKKRVQKSVNSTLEDLKVLDFSSNINKDKLYKFTILAKKYTQNREDKELDYILKTISKYKYQKNNPKIDENIVKQIESYIKNAT